MVGLIPIELQNKSGKVILETNLNITNGKGFPVKRQVRKVTGLTGVFLNYAPHDGWSAHRC
jgi:hypothetical protein